MGGGTEIPSGAAVPGDERLRRARAATGGGDRGTSVPLHTPHRGTRARTAELSRRGAPPAHSRPLPRRCPRGVSDGGAAAAGAPGDFLPGLPEARPGFRYQNHPDQTFPAGG